MVLHLCYMMMFLFIFQRDNDYFLLTNKPLRQKRKSPIFVTTANSRLLHDVMILKLFATIIMEIILVLQKVLATLIVVLKAKEVLCILGELHYGYKKIIDDFNNKKWKQFIKDFCNSAAKSYSFYRLIIWLFNQNGIILNLFCFPLNSG